MNTYFTISSVSEGIYKEKGSKFLAFAIPVRTVEEVKEIVKEYRKEYYDSRHVCYAYMIGADRKTFRANDDGEPSGTAGRPILGQINSQNLTNILVIVIRYFGGILLGTGGLIVAYKQATVEALATAQIVERNIDFSYKVMFEYPQMNDVMRVVKEENIIVRSSQYETDCIMELVVCKAHQEAFLAKINKIDGIRLEEP